MAPNFLLFFPLRGNSSSLSLNMCRPQWLVWPTEYIESDAMSVGQVWRGWLFSISCHLGHSPWQGWREMTGGKSDSPETIMLWGRPSYHVERWCTEMLGQSTAVLATFAHTPNMAMKTLLMLIFVMKNAIFKTPIFPLLSLSFNI